MARRVSTCVILRLRRADGRVVHWWTQINHRRVRNRTLNVRPFDESS